MGEGNGDTMVEWPSLIRGVRALIFDKDGTLLDSEEGLWRPAYERMLERYGLAHTRETHALMLGASDRHCVQILQERHPHLPQGDLGVKRLLRERLETLRAIRQERGVAPMPGVVRFLAWAAEQRLPIAIATSSSRAETDTELALLGWTGVFGAVVTADDVVDRKPHPEPFLKAARLLDVPPDACLAFEDGKKGVQSAAAAGMRVVFLRDTRFNPDIPPETSLVINSFEELLPLP